MKDRAIELLIRYVAPERTVDDPYIDELGRLDEIFNKIYKENRIKKDFATARDMANRAVFNEILNPSQRGDLMNLMDEIQMCWFRMQALLDKPPNLPAVKGR